MTKIIVDGPKIDAPPEFMVFLACERCIDQYAVRDFGIAAE